MKNYLIAAVAISISCTFLGFLGLKGKSRKLSRRLFFLMSCSMAWFLFAAGNAVSSADKTAVEFWYHLSALGFAPFYAFNLHFYISLLHSGELNTREFLLYLPVPIILFSTFISDSLFSDFVFQGGNWRFSPAYNSPWFWVYLVYYLSYTLATLVILFKRAAASGFRVDRIQAVLISIFTMITLILGSVADFVLTNISGYSVPPLGPLITGVYIYGLWFVVIRYGFIEPSPEKVTEEILDNIHEMVFLLDSSLSIIQSNLLADKTLGLDKARKDTFQSFPELTVCPEETKAELRGLINYAAGFNTYHIEYAAVGGTIITDSYCAGMKNSFGDVTGFLVISRQNKCLEDFIGEFGISKREMQVFLNSVNGKSNREIALLLDIAERTVETHMSHIFNKTSTNNRIELFNLAGKYNLIPKNSLFFA
jgi:DNA-binding CsgD family transcriptional regulator/PAS domain-containing protein